MKRPKGALLLVGSADDCPDIEYACGFRAVDPVVLLKHGRKRRLVVPDLELGRAMSAAPGTDVFSPRTLGLTRAARRRLGNWAVRLVREAGLRSVCVSPTFPHGVAVRLQRAGIGVRVARGPLFPEREVKTPEELRKLRAAQQAAVIAMRAAVSLIGEATVGRGGGLRRAGESLTSERVRRTIARVLLDHDCVGRDTIVAGGRQGADPHQGGSGELRGGESIVIDIFPQHLESGYWGDLTRTVVRGAPSPELRAMYLAVKAAQQAALARVRAGVQCATVHAAAADTLAERGFETVVADGEARGFIHSTGHGVGLAIHEGPSVGPSETRLHSGNVITVEPGLYYPELGGVRIEDTVVVTATGWRYLVPCEKKFEL